MPNWCLNYLDVAVPTADAEHARRRFLRPVDGGDSLTFAIVVPEPDPLPDGDGWYWWRVNNWGTKWDAYGDAHHVEQDEIDGWTWIHVRFDTAWAPPMGWLDALTADLPQAVITLTYDEPGMDFGGYVVLHDGVEVALYDGRSWLQAFDAGDAVLPDHYETAIKAAEAAVKELRR